MMKRKLERRRETRAFEFREVRAEAVENRRVIRGYAAVFDQEAEIGGIYREVIRRGAFAKTLGERDQVALWDHESSLPLGRRSKGTLTLREDAHGLYIEIEPPDTTWGNDAYVSIQRGDVKGMSIGFRVIKADWHEDGASELWLREITEIDLWEVSPVTFPAYEQTEVEARAVLEEAERRGLIHTQTGAIDETTGEPDHREAAAGTEPGNHSVNGDADRDGIHSAAGTGLALRVLRQRQIEAESLAIELEDYQS